MEKELVAQLCILAFLVGAAVACVVLYIICFRDEKKRPSKEKRFDEDIYVADLEEVQEKLESKIECVNGIIQELDGLEENSYQDGSDYAERGDDCISDGKFLS